MDNKDHNFDEEFGCPVDSDPSYCEMMGDTTTQNNIYEDKTVKEIIELIFPKQTNCDAEKKDVNVINKENKVDDELAVWFTRGNKRLIDGIINNELNSLTKIGKETKKALKALMRQLEREKKYKFYNPNQDILTFENGKEYISFDDPDFQNALKKYKKDPNSIGGLLYVIEVKGVYYLGLTERTLEKRFEEHITDAIKGYVSTGGDIDEKGYHKFYEAICEVLTLLYRDIVKLHRELSTYSALGLLDKRHAKLNDIYEKIKPFIKEHVIELHAGNRLLGKRESELIEKFPRRALLNDKILETDENEVGGLDYLALRNEGLNTAPGGAGIAVSLPLYDVAIMVAMGFTGEKIAKILQREYNLFNSYEESKFIKTIQHKIEDIFGGVYKAQKELFKPIIEHLDSVEKISRHDIYLAFKKVELMRGWFSEWSLGQEILKKDIDIICKTFNIDPESGWETIEPFLEKRERYYAGISESEWLDFISKYPSKSRNKGLTTIYEKVGISERKATKILKIIYTKLGYSSYEALRFAYIREKVVNILEEGYLIDMSTSLKVKLRQENYYDLICKHEGFFVGRYKYPKNLFENALFRLTSDKIWHLHYKGGILLLNNDRTHEK